MCMGFSHFNSARTRCSIFIIYVHIAPYCGMLYNWATQGAARSVYASLATNGKRHGI
jgi:hypothetical protein